MKKTILLTMIALVNFAAPSLGQYVPASAGYPDGEANPSYVVETDNFVMVSRQAIGQVMPGLSSQDCVPTSNFAGNNGISPYGTEGFILPKNAGAESKLLSLNNLDVWSSGLGAFEDGKAKPHNMSYYPVSLEPRLRKGYILSFKPYYVKPSGTVFACGELYNY